MHSCKMNTPLSTNYSLLVDFVVGHIAAFQLKETCEINMSQLINAFNVFASLTWLNNTQCNT